MLRYNVPLAQCFGTHIKPENFNTFAVLPLGSVAEQGAPVSHPFGFMVILEKF